MILLKEFGLIMILTIREFKKIYYPSLGRYVYEHRGNGLIVDNIMKPLKGVKGAISTAANKAGRAVARAIGKKSI